VDDFSIIPAADELHHALLLGVALVLSAAIGLERQWSGHASGPQASLTRENRG